MERRAVIHMGLDDFFVSVEVKRHPELEGKVVIVGGAGKDKKRGVVAAASYPARKAGVTSGMPLRKAAKSCPDAVFLPVDYEAYEKESERFFSLLRSFTPLVESYGLDEAYVEIPSGAGGAGTDPFDAALTLARLMKKRVSSELALPVSVGVGPNKLVAKICSGLGGPDGFKAVGAADVVRTLYALPVAKLPGVGPARAARLKELGIRTVGQLASTERKFLERNFGPAAGVMLHDHARGVDASPVVPFHEPGSVVREVTFEEDTGDLYIIKETLYALSEDVTARLKSSGAKCASVAIKVRFSDFRTITRSQCGEEPTDSMNDIWGAVLKLLEGVDCSSKLRLVGVMASNLVQKKAKTL